MVQGRMSPDEDKFSLLTPSLVLIISNFPHKHVITITNIMKFIFIL